MKKSLLILGLFLFSCNGEPQKVDVKDSIIVEVPIVVEDTIPSSEEASDSMKDARIKAKDSIKTSLGK